ncbi:aminotransferase class V-fold PLP-dependent enzyme [Terasakiispira papahanaumokuakeensis]|nr:aminotransferase class V-fold PLP-dependent enzyme [Terasakiispira papahanaumokuakeensis]
MATDMAPIYLDNAATTPCDPAVAEVMMEYLTPEGLFANPASRSHLLGWQAEQVVEQARRQVADLIKANPREIVWTSGATESDNLALIGAARAYRHQGQHIITSAIEHKAVLDSAHWLAQEGFEVTYLQPDAQGVIHPEQVIEALRDDTILVSLMWVNNELGTINPIPAIAERLQSHPALFHVDAAQAAGKLPIDMQQVPVDLLSLSAHKVYGPKGVGALFVRREPQALIEPLIHGGGHERGMRSGTLATHQLAGMGKAFEIAAQRMSQDHDHLQACRDAFLKALEPIEYIHHGGQAHQVPNLLNLGFTGIEGETLLMALPDLAVSTGSACNSASVDPSFVLTGIGISREQALSSVRFSFGRFTEVEEASRAGQWVAEAVTRLRTP